MKRIVLITLFFSFFISTISFGSGRKDKNYKPVLKPENFVEKVTNKYFPLIQGKIYTYESKTDEGTETIIVKVLKEFKTVSGIKCTVVRDTVSIDGELIEDTYDWYVQDIDGNVWYMGEYVSNYENGKLVDHEGSFEAGVKGALPGIMMFANPVLEFPYRQEYYFQHAEDWGKVVARGLTVETPYGVFKNCIKTEDWNGLDKKNTKEIKYYAPGVGFIKEESSTETVVLVTIEDF